MKAHKNRVPIVKFSEVKFEPVVLMSRPRLKPAARSLKDFRQISPSTMGSFEKSRILLGFRRESS
jgi:hypothetical protein